MLLKVAGEPNWAHTKLDEWLKIKSHCEISTMQKLIQTEYICSSVLYCREPFVFDCSTAEKKPKNTKDDNSRYDDSWLSSKC